MGKHSHCLNKTLLFALDVVMWVELTKGDDDDDRFCECAAANTNRGDLGVMTWCKKRL